jgi:VanZ family protein
MSPSARRILSWLLVALWAGVIFCASSRPGSTIPGGWSVQGHLSEYFVFGVLLAAALGDTRPTVRIALIAIAIASLYGVTDELHQHFTPGRTPDPVDWATDTVGATAGAFALLAWSRWRTRARAAR